MSTFRPRQAESNSQLLALSGPASAAVFAVTNIMFTVCVAGGSSSCEQMVSQLGASGAPLASVFNLFGFILPGLLVVALAVGLKRELRTFAAPPLLGLCGASFTVVGLFPMGFGLSGVVGNSIHVIAAQLCGLLFVVAAVLLSIPMRKHPSFIQLSRLTPGLVFLLILNVIIQLEWAPQELIPPGWSQRISLVGYFAWLAFAGLSLLTSIRKKGDNTKSPLLVGPLQSKRF